MIRAAQRGSCSAIAMIQDFILSGGELDLLLVVGEFVGQVGVLEVSGNDYNGRVGVRSFNRRDLISLLSFIAALSFACGGM